MKYFEKTLGGSSSNGFSDYDISVHCDMLIFEWLLRYIRSIEEKLVALPLRKENSGFGELVEEL